jgi:hypothetical protein
VMPVSHLGALTSIRFCLGVKGVSGSGVDAKAGRCDDTRMATTGRPISTTSGRLALRIDERLKLRAGLWAMKHGLTLSAMVEAALLDYMRANSITSRKAPPSKPRQVTPPLPGLDDDPHA